MLDRLIPLLVVEVEACGEGFSSSLIEVVGLLTVEAIRYEREPFGEVLINSRIYFSYTVARVLRIERLLGSRHIGYSEILRAGSAIVVLTEEIH